MGYKIAYIGKSFISSHNSIDLGMKILLICQNIPTVIWKLEVYLKTFDHFEVKSLVWLIRSDLYKPELCLIT